MMNDANYSNVRFRAMKVWSAGENGKTKRREMIFGYIISVLYVVFVITFFICSEQKSIGGRIGETLCIGCVSGIIGFAGPAMVKSSLVAMRRNKLIELRLYDIEDFATLGGVPDGMYTAFADSDGVVLCDTKYKGQYQDWIGYGTNVSYSDFEKYYEKHFHVEPPVQTT